MKHLDKDSVSEIKVKSKRTQLNQNFGIPIIIIYHFLQVSFLRLKITSALYRYGMGKYLLGYLDQGDLHKKVA